MSCPHCGSENLKNTRNLNESICISCGCEFKEGKIYVPGDFSQFMESVTTDICQNIADPTIKRAIKSSVTGFLNEGYTSLPSYIDHLTTEADVLYNQYRSGMREKEDFGAIVEGINKLIKWANLHESDYTGYNDEEDEQIDTNFDDLEDEEDVIDYDDGIDPATSVYQDAGGLEMDEVDGVVDQSAFPITDTGCDTGCDASPVIGSPKILGIGSMPVVGGLNTPQGGLPPSNDIALDRAKGAAKELTNALDDLDGSVNVDSNINETEEGVDIPYESFNKFMEDLHAEAKSNVLATNDEIQLEPALEHFMQGHSHLVEPLIEKLGGMDKFVEVLTKKFEQFGIKVADMAVAGNDMYESEDFAFKVGDRVYIGNDDRTTFKIIAIHEGKVVARDNSGQTTTVDMRDQFREVDIQFSREEEAAVVMERAEASAQMMKQKYLAFLESEKVNSGLDHDDDTGLGLKSDEGHAKAAQKKHDFDGEVTKSVEVADTESDGPDFSKNDEDSRHGDEWEAKKITEGEDDIQSDEDSMADEDVEDLEDFKKGGDKEDDTEEVKESVIGDHFHMPDGTKMPFPFTQDPTNSASEEYKEEKMEDAEKDADDIKKKVGIKGKEKVEEAALNGLRTNDVINKGSDFKTQWTVTKITRNPATVHLKSGMKTTIMDPLKESFQYIDGVSLGYERNSEGIEDTKKIWAALEESFKSESSLKPLNESKDSETIEERKKQEVVTKKELYHFVKEGDYHRKPRTSALQELVTKFGNSIEEMESVLDDASLSDGDETVDAAYGVTELGELDTTFALKNAWAQMEASINLQQAADDQKNGEMGGNPRTSSKEIDIMKGLGSAEDIKINLHEGKKNAFWL